MARWRLNEPHYLFGYPPDLSDEGVEWEYKETDRINGRERRKRFKVPFYFERETEVCWEGKGRREDFVFEGPPTPSMEPLDDEAREISASYSSQWQHPIESLPGQGYSDALLGALTAQLDRLASTTSPSPVASNAVSREEFDRLANQLAEVMAKNAELEAKPKAVGNRRVA